MQDLIDAYFARHLALSEADAIALHRKYYTEYGLALTGLVKHHKIDPLEYNAQVDDALPLDEILHRDEKLRALLVQIDRRRVKLWLLTNAHITHARRVVTLLGVEEFFEGVTFCDYRVLPLVAKPHTEMFEKAEREAGAYASGEGGGKRDCYFVDDSALNCKAARERSWRVVQKIEEEDPEPKGEGRWVRRLADLKGIWPGFFVDGTNEDGVAVNGHGQRCSCGLEEKDRL